MGNLQQFLASELDSLGQYRHQRMALDAEADPVARVLQHDLAELKDSLSDEVVALNKYRQQRVQFDAESDPKTRSLQSGLSKLQSTLNVELSQLNKYVATRTKFDAESDPRTRQMQEGLIELQSSLAEELHSLKEFRIDREAAQARLDPITVGLHTELAKLQGSLRSELVQLARQREIRDELESRSSNVLLQIQDQQQELQASLNRGLSQLESSRVEMQQQHKELQQSIQSELSQLKEIRNQQTEEQAHPATENSQKELGELQHTLKSELTCLSEYRKQAESKNLVHIDSERVSPLGLSTDVMQSLQKQIPQKKDKIPDWTTLFDALGSLIQTGDDEIISNGGGGAILGTPGVGKTTTVAKLALQYSLRHGSGKVALISMDTLRIGDSEELINIAMSLEIPFASASSPISLTQKIQEFKGYELILIDTAGMNQRDIGIADHVLSAAATTTEIASYLVISSTSELVLTDEVIEAFYKVPLKGAIITKLDEAVTLGPAISALVRHDLPVTYVCDGQDVQKDIAAPCKTDMVKCFRRLIFQANSRRRAAERSSQHIMC